MNEKKRRWWVEVLDAVRGASLNVLGMEPDEGKPYPNEHACRLQDPGKYDRFARKNCHARHKGKCVDFIFGIKSGKSELQAMRYNKDSWSVAEARAHCKSEGGRFEAASE